MKIIDAHIAITSANSSHRTVWIVVTGVGFQVWTPTLLEPKDAESTPLRAAASSAIKRQQHEIDAIKSAPPIIAQKSGNLIERRMSRIKFLQKLLDDGKLDSHNPNVELAKL
jgi:hypothetical protein